MFIAIGCSIDGDWSAYRADGSYSMGRTLDEYVAEAVPGALLWDARWADESGYSKLRQCIEGMAFEVRTETNSNEGPTYVELLKRHVPGVRLGKVIRSGALPYCEWDTTPEQAAIAKAHREHRRLGQWNLNKTEGVESEG